MQTVLCSKMIVVVILVFKVAMPILMRAMLVMVVMMRPMLSMMLILMWLMLMVLRMMMMMASVQVLLEILGLARKRVHRHGWPHTRSPRRYGWCNFCIRVLTAIVVMTLKNMLSLLLLTLIMLLSMHWHAIRRIQFWRLWWAFGCQGGCCIFFLFIITVICAR